MSSWNTADIPSQIGRRAIVTGATGGLGYETALALAGAGAEVVLTGRNSEKGRVALDRIRAAYPNAAVRYESLNLASLDSVAAFARRFNAEFDAIDLLINNAGVMALPQRGETHDGFEMQLGTNYLGHFALTAQLLPLLRNGRNTRVVHLSSLVHRFSRGFQFDDLQSQQRYNPNQAYVQSKLAQLMFALEMQRRSDNGGWGVMSNAAHAGYARTDLIANGPGADTFSSRIGTCLFGSWASQSAAGGALPTLYAATAREAQSGGYYGPERLFELRGPVADAVVSKHARDAKAAARLWEVSERLTGVRWPEADENRGLKGAA